MTHEPANAAMWYFWGPREKIPALITPDLALGVFQNLYYHRLLCCWTGLQKSLYHITPLGLAHKHRVINQNKLRMQSFCSVFTAEPCLICDPFGLAQFLFTCSVSAQSSQDLVWLIKHDSNPPQRTSTSHPFSLPLSVSYSFVFCNAYSCTHM